MTDPIIKPQDVVFTTDVKEHTVFNTFKDEQPMLDLESDPNVHCFAFTDDFDPAHLHAFMYNLFGE